MRSTPCRLRPLVYSHSFDQTASMLCNTALQQRLEAGASMAMVTDSISMFVTCLCGIFVTGLSRMLVTSLGGMLHDGLVGPSCLYSKHSAVLFRPRMQDARRSVRLSRRDCERQSNGAPMPMSWKFVEVICVAAVSCWVSIKHKLVLECVPLYLRRLCWAKRLGFEVPCRYS